MPESIANSGTELNIETTMGADYVFGVEIRDDDNELVDASALLPWIENEGAPGFTATRISAGLFQVTLSRATTLTLSAQSAYAIGYVDVDTLHKPLLYGVITIPRRRIGSGT